MTLDILQYRADFYDRAMPSPASIAYVRTHGIDTHLVAGFCGCIAVLPIEILPNKRFDFADESGTDAVIIEAYGRDGETCADLIAWPIDRPGTVLTACGRASMVGLWNVHNPGSYYLGKPLAIHRTPLDWLKTGCVGAAVVTPRLAAWDLLEAPGTIAGRDRQHAIQLANITASIFDRSRFVAPAETRMREAA